MTDKKPEAAKRIGWRWADGKMHDTPPPSSEAMTFTPTAAEPKPAEEAPAAPSWPPVPADFAFGDRSRLRIQAIDFALRLAALNHTPKTDAQLIADAGQIERWIAEAQK